MSTNGVSKESYLEGYDELTGGNQMNTLPESLGPKTLRRVAYIASNTIFEGYDFNLNGGKISFLFPLRAGDRISLPFVVGQEVRAFVKDVDSAVPAGTWIDLW